MKASEARELANKATSGYLDKIYKQIEGAAKHGETSLYFYNNLSNSDITSLSNNGYKVKLQEDFKEGNFYKIEW